MRSVRMLLVVLFAGLLVWGSATVVNAQTAGAPAPPSTWSGPTPFYGPGETYKAADPSQRGWTNKDQGSAPLNTTPGLNIPTVFGPGEAYRPYDTTQKGWTNIDKGGTALAAPPTWSGPTPFYGPGETYKAADPSQKGWSTIAK